MLKDYHGEDFQIMIPRSSKSHEANSLTYYKSVLFSPFLKEIVLHLEERFIKHESLLKSFGVMNPLKKTNNFESSLSSLYRMYNVNLNCMEAQLIGEYLL